MALRLWCDRDEGRLGKAKTLLAPDLGVVAVNDDPVHVRRRVELHIPLMLRELPGGAPAAAGAVIGGTGVLGYTSCIAKEAIHRSGNGKSRLTLALASPGDRPGAICEGLPVGTQL